MSRVNISGPQMVLLLESDLILRIVLTEDCTKILRNVIAMSSAQGQPISYRTQIMFILVPSEPVFYVVQNNVHT